MKKKLFVTFAAAALVAAVAPAVSAIGPGSMRGGGNNATVGSNYVTDADIAARVEAEIVARDADLEAAAAQDPAAVAAKAKVDAILANGGGHEFEGAKKDFDNELYNSKMRATDKFRAERIAVYTEAAKADGSYYGRGVVGNQNFDNTGDVNKDGQPGATEEVKPEAKPEEKAKAEEAVKKAATEAKKAEAGKKALPKTSAVK
ncbi:LPKTxAVK-anchored surface protein [Streptococcus sp. ZJ93]|uniref:LPKTxAVK-anchored surface protein n=1 Tax=Streptococcus handemini TaxID=3161188 RepID=UPI0032EEB20B